MQTKILENGNLELTLPYVIRGTSGRKRILAPGDSLDGQEPLVVHLARGLRWQRLIDEGKYANALALARSLGLDPGTVTKTLRLTMLSPKIVHCIVTGNIPGTLTLAALRCSIPTQWSEQEKKFLAN